MQPFQLVASSIRDTSKWTSDHDRTIDAVADFIFGLDAAYRRNATWLMSSLTAATIAKIKDADGRPIWQQSLLMGQPDMLLGRPVEIDEGMPAPPAGQLAIAFGDFKAGYLINDVSVRPDACCWRGPAARGGGSRECPFALRKESADGAHGGHHPG